MELPELYSIFLDFHAGLYSTEYLGAHDVHSSRVNYALDVKLASIQEFVFVRYSKR